MSTNRFLYRFLVTLLVFAPSAASAATIGHFSFTTDPQTAAVGSASDTITIEAQDAGGAAVNGNTVCIQVTSSSGTGEFSTNDTNWSATPLRVLALTLSTNQFRRNFYYRAGTAGSYTLTVKAGLRGSLSSCTAWSPDTGTVWTSSQSIMIGNASQEAPQQSSESQGVSTTTLSQTGDSDAQQPQSGGSFPVEPHIFADGGPDRTVFVGAASNFQASAVGLSGDPLTGARYLWNFGDGMTAEGQSVRHEFMYPGTYTVILDVSSGAYSATDQIRVRAVPAQISIPSAGDEYVEIQNDSDTELDLGGWLLQADGVSFVFPQHTILMAHQAVFFANVRTGLHPSSPSAVTLRYSNGAFAASHEVPLVLARMPASGVSSQPAREPLANASVSGNSPVGGIPSEHPAADAIGIAAVAAASGAHPGAIWYWLGGGILVILLAVAAFALSRIEQKGTHVQAEAEKYDLIDLDETSR